MASKDITKILYDGHIKVDYKDGAHRYYVRERADFDVDPEQPKAWGKTINTSGVTTILGDTLEKKGLMTWPLNMAMRELFGFYDFVNEDGKKMIGFSKDMGTLWDGDELRTGSKDELVDIISSANKAWQRRQKRGADIGSFTHDYIEHYITKDPFPLTLEEYKSRQVFETPEEEQEWTKIAQEELESAQRACKSFVNWWNEKTPELIGTEQVVYSKEFKYAGAYDGLIKIDGKLVLADWKTSNAALNKDAAAPMGVYYTYFAQSAAYALAHMENGGDKIDDLLIVSARKDGEFDTVYLSELGVTVEQAIEWWKDIVGCYNIMKVLKSELNRLGDEKESLWAST